MARALSSTRLFGVALCASGVALALALAGCGSADDFPPPTDGGHRDATIIDGGPAPDGSVPNDGGFVDGAADAGFVGCGREACDPTGDGCADAGVCVLTEGAPACLEPAMMGDGAKDAPCAATTDCMPGLACVTRRGGAVCAELCCPDESATCSDTADRCSGTGTLVDGTPTDWWTCVGPRACDVLEAGAACDPGEACYIISASGDTDCRRAGTLEVGDACATQEDCSTGLFCLIGASTPTCARVCAIGAAAGSPRGCSTTEGACIAYSYSPMGTGICTPPMM